jgi:hypothetical protein
MKLSTVIGSVNLNPEYYLFIPKQIAFWKHFNVHFIAVFVGEELPTVLHPYSNNIVLWDKNLNLNSIFVAQHIRMYYPALLNLNDDEMVMITDMDMLPMNDSYFTRDLETFNTNDFVYYRHIAKNQIYMCYNAAHPKVWANVFDIHTTEDIENRLNETYVSTYNGVPGSVDWFTDQKNMYNKLINYPNLRILNRPIRRLEVQKFKFFLNMGCVNFAKLYDDCHFHRSFSVNEELIKNAEKQLNIHSKN